MIRMKAKHNNLLASMGNEIWSKDRKYSNLILRKEHLMLKEFIESLNAYKGE